MMYQSFHEVAHNGVRNNSTNNNGTIVLQGVDGLIGKIITSIIMVQLECKCDLNKYYKKGECTCEVILSGKIMDYE